MIRFLVLLINVLSSAAIVPFGILVREWTVPLKYCLWRHCDGALECNNTTTQLDTQNVTTTHPTTQLDTQNVTTTYLATRSDTRNVTTTHPTTQLDTQNVTTHLTTQSDTQNVTTHPNT